MPPMAAPSGKPRTTLAALCAAAALALTSCGGGGIAPGDVAADISSRLGTEVNATIEDVRCPDTIPSNPGDTFECTAFIRGGAPLLVPVTITAGGNFEWKVEARARSGADVVAKVQPLMREELNDAGLKLTCPDTTVAAEGDEFDCTAVDSEGIQESVTVVVRGDGYEWQVVSE